jgi:hypothetical protein
MEEMKYSYRILDGNPDKKTSLEIDTCRRDEVECERNAHGDSDWLL